MGCRKAAGLPAERKREFFDLFALAGERYQTGYDESYYAEYGDRARRRSPEHMIVFCEHGEIYVYGREKLGADCWPRGPVSERLLALPCIQREGTVAADDRVLAIFHYSDFDAVAAVMRPRKRRRLSESQRDACVERLRQYRFAGASPATGPDAAQEPILAS